MRISDWSSDVCSSDLRLHYVGDFLHARLFLFGQDRAKSLALDSVANNIFTRQITMLQCLERRLGNKVAGDQLGGLFRLVLQQLDRSDEHTSELQSLMRLSYAFFGMTNTNSTQTNSTDPPQ